jgi:hypothetical protein
MDDYNTYWLPGKMQLTCDVVDCLWPAPSETKVLV